MICLPVKFVASVALVAAAMPAAAPASPPPGYTLTWSDEFNGTSLDTTKWGYRYLGPRKDGVNVKEAITLDGQGNLVITISKVGSEYHTGMIGTQGKFEHRYGYWEARMRFQDQIGFWSAFWIQSPTMGNPIGDPATAGTEIDVIEYLVNTPNTARNTLHWDGYGADHKSVGKQTTALGMAEGYHTAGVLWTPTEYVFYFDDIETWRTSEAVSARTEYAILSCEVGTWAGDISTAILPDSFYVDYVRVYDVPEPLSAVMLIVGMVGCLLRHRSRPGF